LFCSVYLFTGMRVSSHRLGSIGICSTVAMAVFFVSGAVLRSMEFTVLAAVFLFLAVAGANSMGLRFLPAPRIVKKGAALGLKGLLLRGFIAGVIILGVTMAAPLAGSRWAGILSSFPSTLYALLVIVHFETGNDLYPSIIRGFAHSVPALAVFYLGCMVLIPLLGLNAGFAAVYGISAAYIYLTHWMIQKINNQL